MKASHSIECISIHFDDEHLVGNAGLLLSATLMRRLGAVELLSERVDLGREPRRANSG
jgi:hypothetical protein